ncbi:MAG: phosphoribosyltransferase, partial [Acidobacteria bacterium]|nr:phosphoribosyltransferase [Acidobacteriota bacterium]
MRFRDRREAGKLLAQSLKEFANQNQVVVLALPRGGVPVAAEIAAALQVPLDVLPVRKLGTPGQEELAMGAIASGGARVLNDDVIQSLAISPELVESVAERELRELERRERLYRGTRPAAKLTGRTVILVDDGLATGSTMQAAVNAVRQHHPARIVVAVPVAAESSCQAFNCPDEVLTCVCERTVE